MEAMAARIPVVSTKVSGVPELVEDGVSGLLVNEGDPSALAEAINTLLDDEELRAAMGDAGHKRVVEDFDISKTGLELFGFFREAAGMGALRSRGSF